MKTKVVLGLIAVGIASAFTAPARAGVSVDFHIGFPLPPLPVIVAPAPVPCPPPPIVVAPPPVCAPPVVVVRPLPPVCPPPVVVAYPPRVVLGHPRFIPPGHARHYERVEYRQDGWEHGRH